MESGKRWQDWLTSIGTVIALALGGVTFYYQFLRTPRELTAIVLPLMWNVNGGTCTVRTVIWNGGARDEVVEGAYIRFARPKRRPMVTRMLFGPQIIQPGEAKSITAVVRLTDEMWKDRAEVGGPIDALIVPVTGEFHTIDRSGEIIVSRAWLCDIWLREDGRVQTPARRIRTQLNLLTAKVTPKEASEYLLRTTDLLREAEEREKARLKRFRAPE